MIDLISSTDIDNIIAYIAIIGAAIGAIAYEISTIVNKLKTIFNKIKGEKLPISAKVKEIKAEMNKQIQAIVDNTNKAIGQIKKGE
jgi:predicted PurR-regulated permease PerM